MKHLIKFNENTMSSVLYYFNPNDYGDQYMILASSEKDALIYWKDCTVNSLPDKYEIETFFEGDVLETEIS